MEKRKPMKINRSKAEMKATLTLALGMAALLLATKPAAAEPPFLQAAYLWTQATDADLSGSGDWGMYRAWLGVSRLGAESDPGGWATWADTTEGWNNDKWGEQQTRYGTRVLPDILLGIGAMPYDSTPGATGEQKLAWENKQWQLEADDVWAARDAGETQRDVHCNRRPDGRRPDGCRPGRSDCGLVSGPITRKRMMGPETRPSNDLGNWSIRRRRSHRDTDSVPSIQQEQPAGSR